MSATTHPFTPEEIMALLDGELPADRAQSISAHLDQCAECQEIRTSFRDTSAAVSKWAVAPAPAQLDEKVENVLHARGTKPNKDSLLALFRRMRARTVPLWSLAALVTALAFFGFSLSRYSSRRTLQTRSTTAMAVAERKATTPEDLLAAARAQLQSEDSNGNDLVLRRGRIEQSKVSSNLTTSAFSTGDAGSASALPASPPPASALRLAAPMIARTVELSIVVKDFDAARASLDAVLARRNGYAARLNVATPQEAARTLEASLRIPAPQLVAVLAELKALGRVEVEAQNGEEVTQQHADLVARLKNSRETEQRLQAILLQRTGKISDVLSVEQEIARVRGEIEQMEAEQQTLEHRVDFATIDLKLAEEYKAQLSPPAPSLATQLRNASVNGCRNAFETVMALTLLLAESGPTLLLWVGILLFPAWMLWRRYRRAQAAALSLGA